MMRKSVVVLIMILSVLTLSSCSRGGSDGAAPEVDSPLAKPPATETTAGQNTNPPAPAESYQVVKKSFTDKGIRIDYPQIANLGDSVKQEKINKIIRDEALKVLNYYRDPEEDFLSKLTLKTNYIITLQTAKILSIQYWGSGYTEGAAHPNNLFYTTNIDIDTGNRLRLKDLVNVDHSFTKKFLDGKFQTSKPGSYPYLITFGADTWLKYFNNADSLDAIGTENQSDTFSYLTEDSLGISASVSHVEGDHAEFEIRYQDIKENIKKENKVWQGILKD